MAVEVEVSSKPFERLFTSLAKYSAEEPDPPALAAAATADVIDAVSKHGEREPL